MVVVHSANSIAFPEDEGVMAVPGKLTNIAVRRVSVYKKMKINCTDVA